MLRFLFLGIAISQLCLLVFSQTCSADSEHQCGTTTIPVIDISSLHGDNREGKIATAMQIGKACKEIGFFVIVNHGVESKIIDDVWNATAEFFDLPTEEKMKYTPESQADYPYGYNQMGGEVLSAGKDAETSENSKPSLSDLKESFSLGPSNPASGMAPRIFPSQPPHFERAYTAYYTAMEGLASKVLDAFTIALGLEEGFFESFTDRHASAIRALNYPAMDEEYCVSGHVRASAHTDYGTITILKAGGPGLQAAKDTSPPSWTDVPHVEDAYVINLGDLMRRWTNDQWQSTLHQVVNPPTCDAWQRRQSIAFFQNVNRDAFVSALPGTGEPIYEPIVAGDFLMKKHLAATSGNTGYTK